ncbi:MAG: cold shock domain-containing protein [Proteobacteria bacterium]|nr:cold shock domain-containing protein [Pseudomonadota bacterium]
MKIDFGKVERYIEDRGFGFVSHTFVESPSNEIFFHIKSVKRTHPELARALSTHKADEPIYFWYEFETTEKGQQVLLILDPKKISKDHMSNASAFVEMIEKSWMNAVMPLPESIKKATFDLLPPNEVDQLAAKRKILEKEKNRKYEEIQKIEATRLQKIADQTAAQKEVEEDEFRKLVADMSTLGFTRSKDLSAYIVRHKLGHKYPHISGILQMANGGDVWDFNGGFPSKIYARLCSELGLINQGSSARPLKFTAYKDINRL